MPPLVRYVPLKDPGTKIFGNTQPKYKYGFNTNISYKGLTLAAQAELRTGYVVYNAIGADLDFTGGGARSAAKYGRAGFVYPNSAIPQTDASGNVTELQRPARARTAYWRPGGSEFWASSTTWNRAIAENYVTSGMFFKIREASLSYAVPAGIASKLGFVKGASIPASSAATSSPRVAGKISIPTRSSAPLPWVATPLGISTFLQTPPTKFYGATFNVTL
ncbi:MAG: hypothetical protein WKG07_28915 [Hymenobacter sp.]